MIIGNETIKEYDWEILPYEEPANYYLWVDHHNNRPAIVKLSNTSDIYENIELTSLKFIDELIERLNKAKEIFNKR